MGTASTGGRRLTYAALAARQLSLDDNQELKRKDLIEAARDAMKALDIKPTWRLVLGELVGCWGETMVKDRIMVWPSNEYLADRTGLSERSVRYAVRGLVQLRLVTAKDSANGKRFTIKNSTGDVLDAYGFDLTPLYARRAEWINEVKLKAEVTQKIRRFFDEITICRRAIEEALVALAEHYPSHDRSVIEQEFVDVVQRTPRRGCRVDEGFLIELVEAYRTLRQVVETSFYNAGDAGKDCRHIESTNGPNSEACNKSPPRWAGGGEKSSITAGVLTTEIVVEACPALSAYPERIRNDADLINAAAYLRGSLGAHESAWTEATATIGPFRAALAVALTLQLHTDDVEKGAYRIKNPGGYFRAMIRSIAAGHLDIEGEILTLRRRRSET